jgi:hypothetical protein
MAQSLRSLTSFGIGNFASYLNALRKDPILDPPFELLNDPAASESLTQEISIEHQAQFDTKLRAATYLKATLATLDPATLFLNSGLWSWLALFFFDNLCPKDDGRRKPVADSHYILDPLNHKRRYRHLLATPLQIMLAIPDFNRIFLNADLSHHGDLIEQTMSRLYLIRIPAVREAIDILYYDKTREQAKRGIINKTPRRGDLRNRFVRRIQQLSLTFDLGSMDGGQLVSVLGQEFENWQTNGNS